MQQSMLTIERRRTRDYLGSASLCFKPQPLRGQSFVYTHLLYSFTMIAVAPLFLSLLPLVLGRPSSQFRPSENFKSPPSGFSHGGSGHESQPLPVSIFRLVVALASQDSDSLHASLLDSSNPASTNYGKHLSKAEVIGSAFQYL